MVWFGCFHEQPDYRFVRVLGRGAFGRVSEAVHVRSGRTVAIKKVMNLFHDARWGYLETKRIMREVRSFKLKSTIHLIQ
jgi:serine/threonine protein kinase